MGLNFFQAGCDGCHSNVCSIEFPAKFVEFGLNRIAFFLNRYSRSLSLVPVGLGLHKTGFDFGQFGCVSSHLRIQLFQVARLGCVSQVVSHVERSLIWLRKHDRLQHGLHPISVLGQRVAQSFQKLCINWRVLRMAEVGWMHDSSTKHQPP